MNVGTQDVRKGISEGWLAPEQRELEDSTDPRVADRWFVFTRTGARVRVLDERGLPVT